MAKLQQYSAQQEAPVRPAVFANAGAFKYSTASAEALSAVGTAVTNLGTAAQRQAELQKQMDEKYQNHLDDLRSFQAKDAAKLAQIEIDSIYENEPDPAKWEPLVQTKLDVMRQNVSKMFGDVSLERREFLEAQLKSTEDIALAKMASTRLKAVSNKNLVVGLAAYEQAIEAGDTVGASAIYQNMEEKHTDWFVSHDEFDLKMGEVESRGLRKYETGVIDDAKETVAGMIQSRIFTDNNGKIDMASVREFIDQNIDASESLTDKATAKSSLFSYAQQVASQHEVEVADTYDLAIGEAAKGWQQGIVDGTLTPDQVRTTPVSVPPEKEADLAALKERWAGIAADSTETKKRQLEDKRKVMYSAELAGELRSEARAVETDEEKRELLTRATEALASGRIEQADMKTISESAGMSHNTSTAQEIINQNKSFAGIVLSGTGTESQKSYIQTAMRLADEREEALDILKLMEDFALTVQAKKWLVTQYEDQLRSELSKLDPDTLTSDQIREASLTVMKPLLRLRSPEIVERYEQWLN